jgi:hypothetical protein
LFNYLFKLNKSQHRQGPSTTMSFDNLNISSSSNNYNQNQSYSNDNSGSNASVWNWFKQNKIVNTFVEKAKHGVESIVTTVDPQMKEYIRNFISNINLIFFKISFQFEI